MSRSRFSIPAAALVIVAFVVAFAARGDSASGGQVQAQKLQMAQVQAYKMDTVTRSQLLRQVNKSVKIEGFFYDGSIAMVIDDIKRTMIDMMLPRDSYVPIVGPLPPGLRSGDKIVIQGTIQKPTAQDPLDVRRESLIIKVAAPGNITRLQAATARLAAKPIRLPRPPIFAEKIVAAPRQVKYAVLISGGGSPADNHRRYWNDLVTMYNILRSRAYAAANITVIYAGGTGRDDSILVNHSATRANIVRVFSDLASKMRSADKLYIMLNDHGGGILTTATGSYAAGIYGGQVDADGDETGETYSEATYNIDADRDGYRNDTFGIDETLTLWHSDITDDAFAAEVDKIRDYDTMIIQMKQCFSGGFIDDLRRPKRIIMSSSGPENPSYSHSSGQFGGFTYWYFAALTGEKPDGGGSVNADANGDGRVSILEAYNFARANNSAPETPFYEDNGAPPAQSGAVPRGGDGALGAKTFL